MEEAGEIDGAVFQLFGQFSQCTRSLLMLLHVIKHSAQQDVAIRIVALSVRVQLIDEQTHQGIQGPLGKGDVLVSLFLPQR